VQRVANEQWAHWPVAPALAARIRATVEQHFDELYTHGADGFTPRWIGMGREVLITWQPGYWQKDAGGALSENLRP
jgi:hypothetical protein